MDADIKLNTAKANDFGAFFLRHPHIERICFNGQKAAQMYSRFVGDADRPMQRDTLPSTSPAHAAMAYSQSQSHPTSTRRKMTATPISAILYSRYPRSSKHAR